MRDAKNLQSSGLSINIIAGFTKESSSIRASGSLQHVITDKEANTFGLQTENLKNAIAKDRGKKPDQAFLRSVTRGYQYDPYTKHGWDQVQTLLTVVSATIIDITSTPVILDEKKSTNYLNRKATFDIRMTQTVENTATSEWSSTHTIDVSQTVKYGIELIGGSTSLSYSYSWGQGGSHSKTETISTQHGVSIDLEPGEAAIAQLTASKGTMKVRIVYEASLIGGTAYIYERRYEGYHDWWSPIGYIMRNAGISNSKQFTEDIEIDYFGKSEIKVQHA